MDNSTMFLLIDVFVFGAGIYGVMEWNKMKKAGRLLDCKMIMPANCTVANCKDPEAFYTYIMPRFLIFSICLIIGGGISAANDYWQLFGAIGTLITSGIFLAIIVVYCVIIRKSFNRFFAGTL